MNVHASISLLPELGLFKILPGSVVFCSLHLTFFLLTKDLSRAPCFVPCRARNEFYDC